MRIDKYLWSVRLYKTRTMASDEIKKGRVSIGGNPCKASREVVVGDTITVRKNQIEYKIKVLQIPKSRVGAKLVAEHCQNLTDERQIELLKIRLQSQNYYRQKGEGRPTKKDRRNIDEYTEEPVEEVKDEDDTWLFEVEE